jgi:hypothetical protein
VSSPTPGDRHRLLLTTGQPRRQLVAFLGGLILSPVTSTTLVGHLWWTLVALASADAVIYVWNRRASQTLRSGHRTLAWRRVPFSGLNLAIRDGSSRVSGRGLIFSNTLVMRAFLRPTTCNMWRCSLSSLPASCCLDESVGHRFEHGKPNPGYLGTNFHQERDEHEHAHNLHQVNNAIPVHNPSSRYRRLTT